MLYGWRTSTIDIDIRLLPERDEVLREIPAVKEKLGINVELASPAEFIPVKEDWETRSPFIAQVDRLFVYHFDLYAQALSKLERGHRQDVEDVRSMISMELVGPQKLLDYFNAIAPLLYRYPAIDPEAFRKTVEDFVAKQAADG